VREFKINEMKNIEVTDEMHEFLMNLSNELNTQNHRCTRMPYFFQVQTKEQISVPEGCGTEAWHCDGSMIETDAEIEEAVSEYKEWDKHTTKFGFLEDYEIEEILENAGYNKINYNYESKYQNTFFTAKACEEHIELNDYHYNEPICYLNHAWRNPEMELVSKFLCEISGGEIHK
jgi:hypothetical protein